MQDKERDHVVHRRLEWDGRNATAAYALLESTTGTFGQIDLEPHISLTMGTRRSALERPDSVRIHGTVLAY